MIDVVPVYERLLTNNPTDVDEKRSLVKNQRMMSTPDATRERLKQLLYWIAVFNLQEVESGTNKTLTFGNNLTRNARTNTKEVIGYNVY